MFRMVYHVATVSHDRNILAYVCVCVFMRERKNGRFISNCICCRGRAEGGPVRRGRRTRVGGGQVTA